MTTMYSATSIYPSS